MYGIEEIKEPHNVFYERLCTTLQQLDVSLPDVAIVDFLRLGKKKNSDSIRPLLIKLISSRWKYHFFEKAENFKKKDIKLANDLPKEKRIQESKLLKARYILREKGKVAVIKGFKLYSNKKVLSSEDVDGIIENFEKKDLPDENEELDQSDASSIKSAGSLSKEIVPKKNTRNTYKSDPKQANNSVNKTKQTTLSNLLPRNTRNKSKFNK